MSEPARESEVDAALTSALSAVSLAAEHASTAAASHVPSSSSSSSSDSLVPIPTPTKPITAAAVADGSSSSSSASLVPTPEPTPAPIARPEPPRLPEFAIRYAPYLHLHDQEQYWAGNPLLHLLNTVPQTKSGEAILVSEDQLGTCAMLELPEVNTTETFLSFKQDPRANARIDGFTALDGKPDEHGRSTSTCWILAVDKSREVGPGHVDIFYFLFYPYNYGNNVLGTPMGNHVGDWEHVMIRFKDGQPTAIHISAHADGHSFAWSTIEKRGERPVVYVATGSHAMYGKAGTHYYSGVPLVGPVDHTNKGPIWDPTLNYTQAAYDTSSQTFSNLSPPASASEPTRSPPLAPQDILSVLKFKGRWGSSFSDIREHKAWYKKGKQKLSALKWAEAPTGPLAKSLDRQWMTWNSDKLEMKL